ncbi:uncharacterized protein LOC126213298 [Schistocerca nitens]|uniref:uncharacterized protein LOC126213298 n=1 Tax=Schistocerca nitens TaxID=7011 RepID=UPI00211757FB|nr:uncharacterized protein LOC126213298 [Schistocerca nitens]
MLWFYYHFDRLLMVLLPGEVSGVFLSSLLAPLSALTCKSSAATSSWPRNDVECSGIRPHRFLAFGSAEPLRLHHSRVTTPCSQLQWHVVSAGPGANLCAAPTCPSHTSQCRAIQLSSSLAPTSAPAASIVDSCSFALSSAASISLLRLSSTESHVISPCSQLQRHVGPAIPGAHLCAAPTCPSHTSQCRAIQLSSSLAPTSALAASIVDSCSFALSSAASVSLLPLSSTESHVISPCSQLQRQCQLFLVPTSALPPHIPPTLLSAGRSICPRPSPPRPPLLPASWIAAHLPHPRPPLSASSVSSTERHVISPCSQLQRHVVPAIPGAHLCAVPTCPSCTSQCRAIQLSSSLAPTSALASSIVL